MLLFMLLFITCGIAHQAARLGTKDHPEASAALAPGVDNGFGGGDSGGSDIGTNKVRGLLYLARTSPWRVHLLESSCCLHHGS